MASLESRYRITQNFQGQVQALIQTALTNTSPIADSWKNEQETIFNRKGEFVYYSSFSRLIYTVGAKSHLGLLQVSVRDQSQTSHQNFVAIGYQLNRNGDVTGLRKKEPLFRGWYYDPYDPNAYYSLVYSSDKRNLHLANLVSVQQIQTVPTRHGGEESQFIGEVPVENFQYRSLFPVHCDWVRTLGMYLLGINPGDSQTPIAEYIDDHALVPA